MTITEQKPAVPPVKVTGLLHATWAIHILRAALELQIFAALKPAPKSAEALAKELTIDTRGAQVLLDALVGLELIEKREDRYRLGETAELYLVPTSPLFMGDYLNISEDLAKAWSGLTEAIRTGKPAMEVNLDQKAEEFFPRLAATLFPMNYTTAQMAARDLKVDLLTAGARVLDIAAGSGVWSIPMAQQNKGVQVDVLDFPAVLSVTREFANRYEVANQYRYLEGNWRDVELERAAYDIIILGHICHSEGWKLTEMLLSKCREALKSDGRLVIAEFMPNESRTEPAWPLMFAVNMYLLTTDGCVFSEKELIDLAVSKGYSEAFRLELPFWGKASPVVVARK